MTCTNYGAWHLGISEAACESAAGHWFRTPCKTLQETIYYRTSKFDFDTPLGGTCQDMTGELTTAYVSTDNAAYTTSDWSCVEFCRELTDYNDQTAMMLTSDTCMCLYQDGAEPSIDAIPDYATRSPPKFYISDDTNGLTLGLPSDYDCNAAAINVEVQSNIGSVRQQFQLTHDHQIVSASCSGKVLTVTDCTRGMLVFSEPELNASSANQQWEFTNGSITSVGCGKLLSTAEDHASTIESFFSTIVNPTTGWAIGVAEEAAFAEDLAVEVGANYTNDTNTDLGYYFTFETTDWERQFGDFVNGSTFYVNHWRDGTHMGDGFVTVYEYYEYDPTGFCSP